jgi:membrane peptidoglycan carboxypeptidase
MSSLTIVRQRRHRRQSSRRSGQQRSQRAVLVFGFAVSGLLLAASLGAALVYAGLTRGLPPVAGLNILLDPQNGTLLQPTRLYDRSGAHVLAVLAPSPEARSYASYSQLPQTLIDATVALAQPDFWTSPGFTAGGWQDPEKHTTLAQKLVSDLLLWDEPASTTRAIHERMLAAQVTSRYGRQQVLAWYLNSADYGHFAFGAESAARLYFGKDITQLDVSEAALLAAVSQAPALNPIDAPQAAELMRLETIAILKAIGKITAEQADQATAEKPVLLPYTPTTSAAPAFVNLALDQLAKRFDRTRLERGGLDVITTLDYDLQLQTACTVDAQLSRLAGSTVDTTAEGGLPCIGARLLPTLPGGARAPSASASAVILDAQTGQLLAAVGDIHDGRQSPLLASHPAGTLLTPFVYLTGFTHGLNPASLGWDIPSGIPQPGATYHGPVRLRIALANDYLPPAVDVLDQMGPDSVRTIAGSLGLTLPAGAHLLQEDLSLSPLDLAGAYAIFANQGIQAGEQLGDSSFHPVAILKVIGADHSVWLDWSTPGRRAVVSPQLAYLMNQVLSDETARWPSLGHPNALEIGRPAGVKAARTLDASAAWIAGYTPQRVAVVWLAPSTSSAAGAGNDPERLSAGLWHGVMQVAVSNLPSTGWDMPSGVTSVDVCDPSGELPTAACPNVVSEVFLSGREPVQPDTLYQTFQVNRETGLLATVFTPPELVEEHVYMIVPAEARAWAQSAGIPTPPTAYDTLQMPAPLDEANITSPLMFADGRGMLTVTGSAGGTDFVSYRLEYGQGLNPQAWVQIGTEGKTPVETGVLGSWDTTGLDGLYALRLMVVRTDQRVDQAVVQVTIDNTPPQITISAPSDGQTFSAAGAAQVTLQAGVDEPFLAQVLFYIDGNQVGEFSAGPFGLLWPAQVGEHTFKVVASDRAGNTAEATVTFTVKK